MPLISLRVKRKKSEHCLSVPLLDGRELTKAWCRANLGERTVGLCTLNQVDP
jgi:hypothetical protein